MPNLKTAVPNLGIVYQQAKKFYFVLPAHIRASYDLEDFVGDLVLHLVIQSSRYDASKARTSTWVTWVVNRKALDIVAHYTSEKYTAAETLSLEVPEDESPDHSMTWKDANAGRSFCITEAVIKFERFLAILSDSAADLVDAVWFRGEALSAPDKKVLNEIAESANETGITAGEIRLLLSTTV